MRRTLIPIILPCAIFLFAILLFDGSSAEAQLVRPDINPFETAEPSADGPDPIPSEKATLYLRNGDYLPGKFVESPSEDLIRWQTDLFEQPGTFDFSGIDHVFFGRVPRPTNRQPVAPAGPRNPLLGMVNKLADVLAKSAEAAAEFEQGTEQDQRLELGSRVQTTDGHVVFGEILSLDEQWLSLRSARHGVYRLERDRLERIDGLSEEHRQVFDAVSGFQQTTKLGTGRKATDWTVETGRLSTTEVGANIFAPLKHDGPILLELVVSAKKRPAFLVALAAQKNIKLIKAAPSVETWGSQLVAHRQPDDEIRHTVLVESLGDDNRMRLTIYLDLENNRMLVYSGSKLLGELADEMNISSKGKGVFLRNNGADLTVEQFRVKSWNGRSTPIQASDEHVVQLSVGEVLTGQVASIDRPGELTMTTSGNDQPQSFPLSDVDQIVFSQPATLQDSEPGSSATGNMSVGYIDGSLITGKYLRTENDGLVIQADGIDGPFKLGWGNMGHIRCLHNVDVSPQEHPGVIERAGYRMHGRVVQADADGRVMWLPFASQQPVSLNLSTSAKVSFDSVDAARLDSQLTDELHLTNGDTIPCQLLAIDDRDVYVRFADGTEGAVSRDVFKGVRRRPPESYVYQGFADDEVWHVSSSDPNAFVLSDGVLELKRSVYLSRDVGLPERACVSFNAQWTGDCSMYVGYGADESSEAVRRRPNSGYSTKMMEAEAKRPRDFYGEVTLSRAGNSLSANGYLRSSGLMGQAFMNQNQFRVRDSSVLAIDDDSVVNIDIFIDRARRQFSVVANGKTLSSWKETARIDGSAIYLGFAKSDEQNAINFGWGAVVKRSSSQGHVRISNLRVARWPGAMPDDRKERLLTRRLGARPKTVTHVLRAFNGDSLRGNLIALQNHKLVFKSRLDTITLPLEKVAEIIALREIKKPEQEDFSLELHGGGSVVMKPIQVTEKLMIGESPQVGRLAIPWEIVSELNVRNSFSRSVSDLVSWTLRSPPALPSFENDSDGDAATPPSPLIGKPAPELELTMLDGTRGKLSDLQGQTVVLDFWATWCGPCVAAMPQVMEVASENPDDVVLIAVNQQEDAETIETFLATHGWDELTVALDEDGNAGRRYDVSGIPHTVIIDPNGDVQHVHVGASPNLKSTLASEIDALRQAGATGTTESE